MRPQPHNSAQHVHATPNTALARILCVAAVALGALAISFVVALQNAHASGPSNNRLLNYQIRLTDNNGIPVADGTKSIKLTVFSASAAGTQYYTACSADGSATGTPTAVTVTFANGIASVLIGDTGLTCASGSAVAIPATLFDNTALYLGVTVNADAEMTPRKRLVASGFAMNADKLDDLETSDVGGAAAYVPVTDSSGNLVLTQNLTIDTSTLFVNATTNRVGILDTSPTAAFTVGSGDLFTVDSSGNVVLTGSTLTFGSLAADPAGVDGAMFYDSDDDKFRCRINGAWADCDTTGAGSGFVNGGNSFGGATSIGTNDGNNLSFETNNAIVMTLDTSGNLGIGDATPDALLDVAGTFQTDGSLTFGDAGADTVTANAAAWTFANDTTVALSGGVDGINFDSNTLSIDATNNRVGIGTNAPTVQLETMGTTSSNANLELLSISRFRADATAPGAADFGGDFTYRLEGFTDNSNVLAVRIRGAWEAAQTNDTTDRDSYLSFATMADNTLTEALRISSAGDIVLSGGSGSTGCTVTNSNGNFGCAGSGTFTSGLTTTTMSATSFTGSNTTDNNTTQVTLTLSRSRSSATAPGAADFGSDFAYVLEGFTNGQATTAVRIRGAWEAAQTNDTTDRDAYVSFATMADNTLTEAMRINSAGHLRLASNLVFTTNATSADFASGTNGNTFDFKIPQKATTGTCATATAEGLIIKNTGGTQVGHICIDGPTSGTPDKLRFYAEAFNATSTDLAEMYSTHEEEGIETGDVVELDPSGSLYVRRATVAASPALVGVISTSPGLGLTGISESTGRPEAINGRMVALKGRVPVKVSLENGPITPGDWLTSSSTPGVAMKANQAGMVIGRALDTYDGSGNGRTRVFIEVGYWNGRTLADAAEASGIEDVFTLTAGDVVDMQNRGIVNVRFINNIESLAGTNNVWSIAADGTLHMHQVIADRIQAKAFAVEADDETQTVGEGVISVGNSEVTITNESLHATDRIFVTFYGNTEGTWWISRRGDGSFDMKLSKPAATDLRFEYWIVSILDNRTPPPPPGASEGTPPEEVVDEPPLVDSEETEEEEAPADSPQEDDASADEPAPDESAPEEPQEEPQDEPQEPPAENPAP